VIKGLPLAYAKDMQEDKEPVFGAADALDLSLAAMAAMVGELRVNAEAMRTSAEKGYPTATDLADWVVRNLNRPFREAHHIAGRAVKRAEELKLALDALPLKELKKIEPKITRDVYKVLSLETSVRSRRSLGGTAPSRVREAAAYWKEQLS
jgi:argininosuccinate lyase